MVTSAFSPLLTAMINALGLRTPVLPVIVGGEGELPSCFPVTGLATASIAAAGIALRDLLSRPDAPMYLDQRLASFWFSSSHMPINRAPAALWDEFAGDYATRDGWIRLHTNAPHHRMAMEQILGISENKTALARQVAGWKKGELEQAVVNAGGCAAAMLSRDEWLSHPHGKTVATEPLFWQNLHDEAPRIKMHLPVARPLAGIKVLDLTRIIAGPVATRFLAGLGATVLRLDPPGWEEPTLAEEVTLGKKCARLDLKSAAGREQFKALLCEADVLVHGYRSDALEALGFDEQNRQAISPGLIDVSLNAWGWTGPWRNRRGFDSLVQMACGIAEAGQRWQNALRPHPLPVQALDHATGYLMAAAVLRGLKIRQEQHRGYSARLSLARTAAMLLAYDVGEQRPLAAINKRDLQPLMEWSVFGCGSRLKFPLMLAGTPLAWATPPVALGSGSPGW
ncbi:Formyl-coenzyme A transferase [Cedecea davisae]|uniref:III protein, CoA-transferase family n=1 Tax=Cedecea davisae DSM 4568 TaxID=566551 RepID=S3JT59_9ENTR|nr:CoA transferase [Cedecea davisae]EPF16364.1 III protein, CoA-transferase family [Cedecea davisae DSM 4568]SUX38859.1 Formyl-coenzyme A transferase [Cedecea davisae]